MASGWWDASGTISGCVAAYQPIGAASLAASYVNLQNPGTYDLTVGSAVGFDTDYGWTFDGTSRYLRTGITAYQPMTAIVRARTTNITNYRSWLSAISGGGGWHLYHTINGGSVAKADFTRGGETAIGTSSNVYPTDGTSYVVAISFDAGDNWAFYDDGVSNGSGTTSVAPFNARGITIGDGIHNLHHYGSIAAVALFGSALSGADISTVSTAMAALPVASAKGLPIIMHHHHAVFGGG